VADTGAKRGRKKKFEDEPAGAKKTGGYESAMEYSDGNDEYDAAVKDNHINDDSGAENVEFQDLIEDLPSEEAEPSESDAKSKTSKGTNQ
jgi:hypothetical protein